MIQAPSKIAGIWFGDQERATATTIGALSGPIGSVVGFVFPVFFIDDETLEEMYTYLFWQAVYVTAAAGPIIFLIRNRPAVPPSSTAKLDQNASQDLWRNAKSLLSSFNFWILMTSYSLAFSI